MTQAIVVIGIILAIAAFVYWFKFIHRKKAEWMDEAINNMDGIGLHKPEWQFQHQVTTPGGARIRSMVPVPSEALAAIDRGLQRRIDRFTRAFPNWTLYKNVSDHDIFMVPPRGVSQVDLPGAPLIHVKGITAAGTVLGCDEHYEDIKVRPIILIPHQGDQNWQFLDYLADSVHNESEHVSGWVNRRLDPTGIFYNFIGGNDVHPWPIDPQVASFVGREFSVKHTCGVR